MRKMSWLFAVLVVAAMALTALPACNGGSGTAADSVDETLDSVDQTLSEAIATADEIEAEIQGIDLGVRLEEAQTKLTEARDAAGDKKLTALEELSTKLGEVITTVETAAAGLPEGGALKTKLTDFAAKLQSAQDKIDEAAASL